MIKSFVLLIFLSILANNTFSADNYIRPFTSDGCSSVPDLIFTDCCISHDVAYWQGGTYDQRLQADENLYQCVKALSGSDFTAGLFYYGVRVGGRPGTNQSYRWGYGWAYKIPYRELTSKELEMVAILMPDDPYDVVITDGGDNRVKLPSKFDNYCLDEAYSYILENFSEKIEKISYKVNHKGRIKHLSVKINEQEIFKFSYRQRKWQSCTRPVYDESLPNYYHRVERFSIPQ